MSKKHRKRGKEMNEKKETVQEETATGGVVPIPPLKLGEFNNSPEEILPFRTPPPPPKTEVVKMVEAAFNHAVVETVNNDETVRQELIDGAKEAIHNKTEEIKAKTESEAKEALFNNKKGACECFGYNETTTEKWAVSIMGIWHNVITAIWIVLGMFTFAPVTFVAKKVSVIIKQTWLAVIVALVIYVLFALSPVWVGFVTGWL